MHSCTKGTHTAGSHHMANYRSKATTLIPNWCFQPLSHDPHPPQMTTNSTSRSLMTFSCLSLPRQCCIVNYPEKRKRREKEEEEEISSEYVVFSSQDKASKVTGEICCFAIDTLSFFFFFLKSDSTKYKLFNCSLIMTMSDFYCMPDIS